MNKHNSFFWSEVHEDVVEWDRKHDKFWTHHKCKGVRVLDPDKVGYAFPITYQQALFWLTYNEPMVQHDN